MVVLWIIIGLIVFVVYLTLSIFLRKTKRSRKGLRGELQVNKILGDTIYGEKYVINNFSVSLQENKSMQVDHILINPYGVFVIETKNFSGVIYGSENSIKWKQYIKSRNKNGYAFKTTENEFYNPIKQNRSHIYNLSKIINRKDCFKNIVVFCNSVESVKCNVFSNAKVIMVSELQETLKKFDDIILSPDDMLKIFNSLLDYQNSNLISIKQHKRYVQNTRKLEFDNDF